MQIQELKADHQSVTEDWDEKLRALQDKIDILQHDVEEDKKKNEKINQDMDARLAQLEKRSTEVPVASAPSTSVSTAVAPESSITPEKNVSSPVEQDYQTILDSLLEEKNYDRSIKDFKKFIQKHPNDPLVSNAQYWIAESYYSKADYPKAITEFQKVLDQYPNSTKRCDALLKQGMAFSNMKDQSNAKLFLIEAKEQCTGNSASQKAEKLLKDFR